MNSEELKRRTKMFALEIIRITDSLPKTTVGYVIGRQLLRAGTSVGANYRSACKARSRADFVSKITIVEEESDESQFWLELIEESGLHRSERLAKLKHEAGELTAIFTATGKTARQEK